jgi:hypothetical protein
MQYVNIFLLMQASLPAVVFYQKELNLGELRMLHLRYTDRHRLYFECHVLASSHTLFGR